MNQSDRNEAVTDTCTSQVKSMLTNDDLDGADQSFEEPPRIDISP